MADSDHWLPKPQIRVYHHQRVEVPAQVLWDAAESVRLDETGRLGRLVRWRIPMAREDATYYEMFAEHPFTVLESGPRHSVSGLCGRLWTFGDDYHVFDDPEEFRGFERGGNARVCFSHWVTDEGDGTSTLHSESRVKATDFKAKLALRPLGLLVKRFDRLIGTEPLSLAARRATRAD